MLELLCLCMCPVEDWNMDCGYKEALHSNVGNWTANCGYEEALHRNGGTGIACERGPDWPGDKVSIG